MAIGILGRKLGMTQIFDENNNALPVTVIEAGPCPVVQKKTVKTDSYNAVQLGFLDKKRQRLTKPELGHFDKANVPAKRYLREFRLTEEEIGQYETGQEIKVNIFQAGDFIDVTGTSKGKGFSGVIKRHHFAGSSEMSHGTHEYFRHGGSIGSATYPGKVFKGRKMAGQKGNEQVTVQNLKIVEVREETNVILVLGSVPGATNSLVMVRKAVKKGNKKK
ncbi:50S ribosomal protein L3 [Candidatus Moduliflexus flocculans]|uniref:Large ribosomal subunit protein uL3 n=1 Tax=Candidatus Moduliflexus flocculans TaxID=1499966 RepID=A0A0S6W4X7_9BACT|nr:50S ribosomal protein L3 [Candidatus Moduliflexus flocculans]